MYTGKEEEEEEEEGRGGHKLGAAIFSACEYTHVVTSKRSIILSNIILHAYA